MTIIILIRIIIWLTFMLMVVECVAAIILARRAVKVYVKKHRELEIRVDAIERRIALIEEHLIKPED